MPDRSRPRGHRGPGTWLAALLIIGVLAGGPGTVGAVRAAPAASITVFAAASLTEAFTVLGKVFEERTPGLRVTFNFAGSQQLALQIEQGARADVFASADQRWMTYLQQRGLILGTPREFARNRLVIVIPRSNPGRIARLQDLARDGVKVLIAGDAVPAGRYTREVLAKLDRAPGFGPDWSQRVLHNVVSEEDNVKAVVAKVQLGEADAGAVYRSDVTSTVSDKLGVIDVPDPYNIIASYPIALIKSPGANRPELFVALVLSQLGQQFLRGYNFIPAAQP
jgi:molybdate transport system substrate-binding protein